MWLPGPVFRSEALGSMQAFKLSETPRGKLYLGEELVQSIRAAGYTSGTDITVVYERH